VENLLPGVVYEGGKPRYAKTDRFDSFDEAEADSAAADIQPQPGESRASFMRRRMRGSGRSGSYSALAATAENNSTGANLGAIQEGDNDVISDSEDQPVSETEEESAEMDWLQNLVGRRRSNTTERKDEFDDNDRLEADDAPDFEYVDKSKQPSRGAAKGGYSAAATGAEYTGMWGLGKAKK
jgi:hypothetical protein